MSVYQVDQYYIYMSLATASKERLDKINKYLDDNGFCDYEHQGDCISIDGFESESDAKDCERAIEDILSS